MPHKDRAARLAYNVAYRLRHQASLQEQDRSRSQDPQRQAKRKEYLRAFHARHPDAQRATKARRRAQKAGALVNTFSPAQWREMKAAYGYRCVYCDRKMKHLTMDHITPLARGGMHTVWNIVPACWGCNKKKFLGPPLVPVQPLLLTLAPPKPTQHTPP